MAIINISAVVNTRNEEKNIEECLNSLQFADEIIVVDMESTDLTKQIAKRFTDKVFDHEMPLVRRLVDGFSSSMPTKEFPKLSQKNSLKLQKKTKLISQEFLEKI